jgi:hypothetical protein
MLEPAQFLTFADGIVAVDGDFADVVGSTAAPPPIATRSLVKGSCSGGITTSAFLALRCAMARIASISLRTVSPPESVSFERGDDPTELDTVQRARSKSASANAARTASKIAVSKQAQAARRLPHRFIHDAGCLTSISSKRQRGLCKGLTTREEIP